MAARRRGSNRYNTIVDVLAQLPIEFLRCRVRRHRWDDNEHIEQITQNVDRVWLECDRCSTQRWIDQTQRGNVLDSGYRYPAKYVIKDLGVMEQADNDMFRAALAHAIKKGS